MGGGVLTCGWGCGGIWGGGLGEVGEVCFDELGYEGAIVKIMGKGIRYENALLQCGVYPTEIFWWDG